MLHTFFFSPSDTTRKYAKAMTDAFGGDSQLIDLTHGPCEIEYDLVDGDTALLISPVYAGRIPAMAADLFRQIDGHGMKAIVAVVYGNRDYDDALLELADIAAEDGFEVMAAGAFIAQHCIFPNVANGRPDASDLAVATDFIKIAKESGKMEISTIKGNRPYKKPGAVPLRPRADKNECRTCGVCARECPTGAIDPVTLATDKSKCITCCRCITVCGSHARKFKGIMYATVGKIFCAQNSKRREPELFLR
ncbi:MAG: 4Fe-4S binding protein [Paramuribaculum sp.]|nr:4Fe-4S binding protein [Paramuribaculum sp.]